MRLVPVASVKSLPVKRLSLGGPGGLYTAESVGKFYLILCEGPRLLLVEGSSEKVFEFSTIGERSNYLVRYINDSRSPAVGV